MFTASCAAQIISWASLRRLGLKPPPAASLSVAVVCLLALILHFQPLILAVCSWDYELNGEQKLLHSSGDVSSCFSALLSATGCKNNGYCVGRTIEWVWFYCDY